MADIADVASGLVDIITSLVYPAGVGHAPEPAITVKIYPGWPDNATLDTDLGLPTGAATAHHISVFNTPVERATTRYVPDWEQFDPPAATYAAIIVGQVITISGGAPTVYSPQNVALIIGPKFYVHTATAAESPASIAAALGALMVADYPSLAVVGPAITMPGAANIRAARVGVLGDAQQEVGRQERGFQITIWTESDAARQVLARLVGPGLRAMERMTLADRSIAKLTYRSSGDLDNAQRQGVYRRDFLYMVEYATTIDMTAPQIVATRTDVEDPAGHLLAAIVE